MPPGTARRRVFGTGPDTPRPGEGAPVRTPIGSQALALDTVGGTMTPTPGGLLAGADGSRGDDAERDTRERTRTPASRGRTAVAPRGVPVIPPPLPPGSFSIFAPLGAEDARFESVPDLAPAPPSWDQPRHASQLEAASGGGKEANPERSDASKDSELCGTHRPTRPCTFEEPLPGRLLTTQALESPRNWKQVVSATKAEAFGAAWARMSDIRREMSRGLLSGGDQRLLRDRVAKLGDPNGARSPYGAAAKRPTSGQYGVVAAAVPDCCVWSL